MTKTKESLGQAKTLPKFSLLFMPLGKKVMLQILSDWRSCQVGVLFEYIWDKNDFYKASQNGQLL